MNKNFYLTAAACFMLAATGVKAQHVVTEDMEVTLPASWGEFAGMDSIIIAGAKVTITSEPLNTCAFPFGDGSKLILVDGAELVMYDSPETWYPSAESALEAGIDPNDICDGATSEIYEVTPWNIGVSGEATIVADSKCRIGGNIFSQPGDSACHLTIVMGDSTILAANFRSYFGKLTIKYRDEAKNNTILIGQGFPGNCWTCSNDYTKASSAVCWDGIPFVMSLPDNTLLKVYDKNVPMAYPAIEGENISIENGTGHIFFRQNEDWTYNFASVTGGSDARNFELYAGGNATFLSDIQYVGKWAYPRNCGVWINGQDSIFTGMLNEVSVRNSGGFVGGNGILACGISMKEGSGRDIVPGEAYFETGDLTVGGSVWLNNNNGLILDFGGEGDYDRLIVKGARAPKCYISGANTRIYVNILDEFHANPVAGDYQVVVADEFVPNTVYETDTTGTRFGEQDLAVQQAVAKQLLEDSVITFPTSSKSETELIDSLCSAWATMFENFANPSKKDRDTLFCYITKIDTVDWEINQAVDFRSNKKEDGTYWNELPEGYSYYPLDIYTQYADSAQADSAGKALISEKFFSKGIISIYGPGYKEEIVPVKRPGSTQIENVEGAVASNRYAVSSQIYTPDGMPVPVAVKGINIVRTVYSDGTVDTRKLICTEE